MEKSISFPTDPDGFVSQECPACKDRFMVNFGEGSELPVSYCPYCCHHGHNCWWTPEQARYIEEITQEMAANEIDSQLKKMARRINQSSRSRFLSVKMKTERTRTPTPRLPNELSLDLPVFEFSCCNERIKYFELRNDLFCIICGSKYEEPSR